MLLLQCATCINVQLPRVLKQLLTVQKSCELTARPSSLIGNFTSQEPTMFWILNSLKVAWKPSLMMILQYCTRTSSVRQGIKDPYTLLQQAKHALLGIPPTLVGYRCSEL
jgi:hypothetical protein